LKRFSNAFRVALAVAFLAVGVVRAQSKATVVLQVSAADFAAKDTTNSADSGSGVFGVPLPPPGFGTRDESANVPPPVPAPGFYNTDVSNTTSGPVVVSAQHHPIYVNQPASHWGDPATFLADLGNSQFIHLLDQYVGNFANGRYTLGTSFFAAVTIPPSDHTLRRPDILALVHAAALQSGSGLAHTYHVFLPQGVDVCMRVGFCYTPDVPQNWTFCALHSSAVFNDLGLVIFTLEPYQNVIGCSVPPHGTPNGQTADSTNSTLSHEVFETITDPVVGASWYVRKGQIASGEEVADLCVLSVFGPDGNVYSNPPNAKLNGRLYAIQAEYSNLVHGCLYPAASDGN
jgi:hypothetical protein